MLKKFAQRKSKADSQGCPDHTDGHSFKNKNAPNTFIGCPHGLQDGDVLCFFHYHHNQAAGNVKGGNKNN